MDPVILAGMIFALIVLVLLGGFVLLLPLSRRLGELLDMWVSEQKNRTAGVGLDVMLQALGDLSRRIEALEEQQDFLERLVTKGELPAGDDAEEA